MERDRLQNEVARFAHHIGATPMSQMDKFHEEVREVWLEPDRTSREFAMELTDVVIVAIGLIHCIGLNFEDLFDEKMKINWEKYAEVPRLKELGMGHGEAVERIRKSWAERQR